MVYYFKYLNNSGVCSDYFFSFYWPLPTNMPGNSLSAEQWEGTKEVPSAVLPPGKTLPFIGKTEQGTSHLKPNRD